MLAEVFQLAARWLNSAASQAVSYRIENALVRNVM